MNLAGNYIRDSAHTRFFYFFVIFSRTPTAVATDPSLGTPRYVTSSSSVRKYLISS